MKGIAGMADGRRVGGRSGTLRRRGGRLMLIASAVIVLSQTRATPASRPIRAECVSLGCRLYLPHVGGRHRLDLSEYGADGRQWRQHGLTDRIVDMAYDSRGHLWTATLGGLVEWPPAPAAPVRHSMQAIRHVAVDAADVVWFGGEAGRAGERLHRRGPDGRMGSVGPSDGLPGGALADLATDGFGQVFAAWRVGEAGGGGLSRIDASGTVRSWRQSDGLKHRDVTLLATDDAGAVWFGQVDEAQGRPSAGLGQLSRDGRLRPDVAMPENVKDLPVVGLAEGTGAGLLVIFDIEAAQARSGAPSVAFGEDASRGDGGAGGLTALFERDRQGAWTEIVLPLDIANAQRIHPLDFDLGPRAAITDDEGTLWVLLEGIAVAMSPSGRLAFQPTNLSPVDSAMATELAGRLGVETVAAPKPGGGLAVATQTLSGWMALGSTPGAAPTLRRDGAALPVQPQGLAADPAGRVYLSGGPWDALGVWRMPAEDGAWEHLGGMRPLAGLVPDSAETSTVGPVHVTPDGVYWIADGPKLLRIAPDRRERRVIRPADGLTGGRILCFATGKDGTLWVGTTKGLLQLDRSGRWLRHDLPGMPPRPIMDLAAAPDGAIWLALAVDQVDGADADGGIARILPGEGSRFWPSGPINGIPEGFGLGQWRLAVAADGSVWTSGDAGLAIRDPAGLWRPMNHEAGLEPFEPVGDVEVDARGDIWVASRSGGVLRYEPGRDRWTPYTSTSTAAGLVTSIAADTAGGVWFGLSGDMVDGPGLLRRDPAGRWQAVDLRRLAPGVDDDRVSALALTPDGSVVATTFEDYLLLYGSAGVGMWMPQDRLPPTRGSLPLCADREGRLWTLPPQGLAAWSEETGWSIKQSADGLPYPSFSTLICAADGSLWLGNPPLSFDQQRQGIAPSGTVRRLPDGTWQDLRQELGLGIEGVGAMASSPDGTVALATVRSWMPGDTAGPTIGTGLMVRHADGRRVRLTPGQLQAAELRALVYDPQGVLWLATERGVRRLAPGGEPVVLPSIGLPSPDVRDMDWAHGRLWAATALGAAERLNDGRWRPYDREDGLADADLQGLAIGPARETWFLSRSGAVSVLLP